MAAAGFPLLISTSAMSIPAALFPLSLASSADRIPLASSVLFSDKSSRATSRSEPTLFGLAAFATARAARASAGLPLDASTMATYC